MKNVIAIGISVGSAFLMSGASLADDVADIKALTLHHFETLASGDTVAHTNHHMAGHSSFGPEGGALEVEHSLEEERAALQKDYDDGLRLNIDNEGLHVMIYGDAAVVTSIQVGSATLPDGTTEEFKSRRTAVLVRDGSDWKEVHAHLSEFSDEASD